MTKTVQDEMKTVGFRGTEDYRWSLKQAAGARRRSLQRMLEEAAELYLSVSVERFHAGDIERLKDYAAFLALPRGKSAKDSDPHGLVSHTIEATLGKNKAKTVRFPEQKREKA